MWQNAAPSTPGKRARHKAAKPKPYQPSFMRTEAEISEGSSKMTVDDIKSWLDTPRGV